MRREGINGEREGRVEASFLDVERYLKYGKRERKRECLKGKANIFIHMFYVGIYINTYAYICMQIFDMETQKLFRFSK